MLQWCQTGCSCGSLRWLWWWGRRASSCRPPPSTTTVNRLTRQASLSNFGSLSFISAIKEYVISLHDPSRSIYHMFFVVVAVIMHFTSGKLFLRSGEQGLVVGRYIFLSLRMDNPTKKTISFAMMSDITKNTILLFYYHIYNLVFINHIACKFSSFFVLNFLILVFPVFTFVTSKKSQIIKNR